MSLLTTNRSSILQYKPTLFKPQQKPEDMALRPSTIAPQWKYRPQFILVLGQWGGGKSLYMQWKQVTLKARWKQHRNFGRKIFANYDSAYADTFDPDVFRRVCDFDPEIHDGAIFIDEIAGALPSNTSQSSEAYNFYHGASQSRKKRLDLMAASQHSHIIDKKVLLLVTWVVNVRPIMGGKGIICHVWDLWGTNLAWLGPRKPMIPSFWDFDLSYTIMRTNLLWGSYDTETVFVPSRHSSRESILQQYGFEIDESEDEVAK